MRGMGGQTAPLMGWGNHPQGRKEGFFLKKEAKTFEN
jgi:hypothetical protein